MTTQRLNTVINIGGGLSDRFRGSVQGGAEDIGRLQASMRQLRTRASEIDTEIARGGFGRPVFNAAKAELADYDTAIADAETQIESLQRELDRGDLGRRDATRAESAIEEYRRQIAETEESARDLRQEFDSGDFGEASHKAAARAAGRHRDEIDRLGGQVRNTSGRFGRFRSIGVGAMTAVAGAALATTAVVIGIGSVVGDVTQRFERLQELTRRTNVDTQQLTRAELAGAQLGFNPAEIADSFAEAQSELRKRVGEFQEEGTGQLVDAQALGVDVGQLGNLEGVERYRFAIEELRRVAEKDGDAAADRVADLLFGGQEAQNAFTIATLASEEQYQRFLDTLVDGETVSEATIGALGNMGIAFFTSGVHVDNAKASLVGLLEPVLVPVLNTIGDLAKATTGWIDENRTLATVIGGVVLGGILAATIGIGVLTALIVAGMIPSLFGMAVAGWAAIAPLLPFIAIGLGVLAVVGAITAGVIWMVRNWDRVTDFFDRHWPRIALAVGIIIPPIGLVIAAIGFLRANWDEVTAFFGTTWDAITGFFSDGADFVTAVIGGIGNGVAFLRQQWDRLADFFGGPWQIVAVAIGIIIPPIGLVIAAIGFLRANWDEVTAFFGTTWDAITGFFSDGADFVTAVIGGIGNGVAFLRQQWDRLADFFGGPWQIVAVAIGIIIPPIGLVIAAIGFLRANWDEVTAFFGTTWDAITGFFSDGADFVTAVIGGIGNGVAFLRQQWDRLADFFGGPWQIVAVAIGIIIPPIGLVIAAVGLLRANWDEVTAFFGTTWDAITGFFSDGADFVALQVNRVLGFGRQMAEVIHRLTGGLIDLRDSIPGDISIGGDDDDARPLDRRPPTAAGAAPPERRSPPAAGVAPPERRSPTANLPPPAPTTVVEGDTTIYQDITINQLPGESEEAFDRRLNKAAVGQIDAVAGAR